MANPTLLLGDCREVLATLDEASIDAIVCDPPYELGFMGKGWDNAGVAYSVATWSAALRVLKPGGHLLAFGAPRTYHRMTCAIEDAGFEIRDSLMWLFGSGFPKSLDVSKALDKAAPRMGEFEAFAMHFGECWQRSGLKRSDFVPHFPHYKNGASVMAQLSNWALAKNVPSRRDYTILRDLIGIEDRWETLINRVEAEREIVGKDRNWGKEGIVPVSAYGEFDLTAPATDLAREWEGWGTALKPAYEPIVMARKPLVGTVAGNVAAYGVGGLNIDGCRIEGDLDGSRMQRQNSTTAGMGGLGGAGFNPTHQQPTYNTAGRWPANVVLDAEAAVLLDAQSGDLASGYFNGHRNEPKTATAYGTFELRDEEPSRPANTGGASRFFYTAKTSRSEREFGLDDLDPARRSDGREKDIENPRLRTNERRNDHPTVKPVDLMRWLCRLVTPPDGTICDPFLGSGSTGMAALDEGFNFIGIDLEPRYLEIARRRINRRHVIEPLPSRDAGQQILF